MSKEKTPFEKTAAALKVMGKKIAAKKKRSVPPRIAMRLDREPFGPCRGY